ncbi:hypothetical protein IAT38_001192 [Cryptococcus sp. DSM 104549]
MSFSTIATLAVLASASIVSAAPVNCARAKPDSYSEGYLESYDEYHTRYIALECYNQHNSTFFDDCCHPLLANETLADARPSYCSPNSTVISSVSSTIAEYTATATASATASADADAEAEYYNATSTEATASATATIANVAEVAQASSSAEESTTSTTSSSATPTSTSSSSSSEEATSTSSSESSSATGTVYTGGYATFYSQGGVAGECGTVHSDDDYVIAIDSNGWWQDYESNDSSPYCGKYITLTNTNNGKSVRAVVADVCPTCETKNSLDLSKGAFDQIATREDGMVPITWYFS